jgi:hypothetical protein
VESATTTGPWLTASLKHRLRPYRTAKGRGVFSIDLAPNADAIPTTDYGWGDD